MYSVKLYIKGVWAPRSSSNGSALASPRQVSTTFIKFGGPDETSSTLMLMTWGQFITHDLTKASSYTSSMDRYRATTTHTSIIDGLIWFIRHRFPAANGQTPQCCNATSGGPLPTNLLHPYCLPIAIPGEDPDYGPYNQTCMSFVRTQTGGDFSCTMGHAEQVRIDWHYCRWMASIYVSFISWIASLIGWTLQLCTGVMRPPWPPFVPGKTDSSKRLAPVMGRRSSSLWRPAVKIRPAITRVFYEFQSHFETCNILKTMVVVLGDVRAQENPQLAVTHTLMMREHNRLARELKKINPKWDDEILFQEARRILIAQIQHITYNEYLPVLLGIIR